VEPTSAGMVRFSEIVMPVVVSAKGFVKTGHPGASLSAALVPNVNAKVHSQMTVMCPFTGQMIAAGAFFNKLQFVQ
jgi:hypothetical protein